MASARWTFSHWLLHRAMSPDGSPVPASDYADALDTLANSGGAIKEIAAPVLSARQCQSRCGTPSR